MSNSNEIPNSCPNCQRKYDMTIIPLKLPCGHCYCEVCLTEYQTIHHKVKCFSENKEYEIIVSALTIPYFYKMLSNLSYICSKHQKEVIKFVCDEHKEFMCCLCIWDHAEHKKSTRIYLEEELLQDIEKIELKLNEMKN